MESPGSNAHCPVRQQRARWERKRVCTARELLETERRYQEQLGLVATVGLGGGVGGSQTLLRTDVCSCWLHLDVDFLLRQTEKTVFVPFTVLLGDPESQGDTTTTRAPGPVWELGANLCRQPVSGSGAA